MQNRPFDSRNKFYKSRICAIAVGESVKFRIVVPRLLECHAAFLSVKKTDSFGYENQGMFWAGMHGDQYEIWDITFSPNEQGVYTYHFELNCNSGTKAISPVGFGLGDIGNFSGDFRQVVYRHTEFEHSSLENGIIYQIFPDRFNFSGTEKKNVPSDRIIRKDWGGTPEYRTDENGRFLCNDYFCGDFKGIEEKLRYIKSLGATHIYLNPIFEAHSNHRYNTADFTNPDPLLGTEEDFSSLCRSAKKQGIIIILDGVFSHVGSDSIYFNKEKRYQVDGAWQGDKSQYRSWFNIRPNGSYDCWWGIDTLPEINEDNPEYTDFIKGIIRKWMKLGANGWRLDVADELPDKFLDSIYAEIKSINPNAPVICEVWENACDKISYGVRRRYLLGGQADSFMNYPFSNAILGFIHSHNGNGFIDSVMSIKESYPEHILNSLMTHLSNHDTQRFLTAVSTSDGTGKSRQWQGEQPPLTGDELNRAIFLLKAGAIIQYSLPGVPTIYYGDEAGLQGHFDPLNRRCFPWGNENSQLTEFYRKLGKIRSELPMTAKEFVPVFGGDGTLCFACVCKKDAIICAVNISGQDFNFKLPDNITLEKELISAGSGSEIYGSDELMLKNNTACILLGSVRDKEADV